MSEDEALFREKVVFHAKLLNHKPYTVAKSRLRVSNDAASEISQRCENHYKQLSLESIDDYDQLRIVVDSHTFYYATRITNTLVYIDKITKWYLIYDCTGF